MATDINDQIIEKAKIGLYSEKSIACVPEDKKKEFFTKTIFPQKAPCLFLYLRFIFDAGDFATFTQKHALFISP